MTNTNHRFFLAWPDHSAPVIELPGPVWNNELTPEVRYPLAVLSEATRSMQATGLHFYLTKDPDVLPEYGSHVVAVVILEERCKYPAYGRHVRAVIRNLQSTPFIGFRMHPRMGQLEAVESFEFVRDWAIHLRSLVRMRQFVVNNMAAISKQPHIITIPLGYHSQNELPILPMHDRQLDSFFSGEVNSHYERNDYRYWTSTSKVVARRQLFKVLDQMQKSSAENDWNILGNEIDAARTNLDAAGYGGYSERMQQSRICIAPRGSVAETYRIFEGLRSGCLVMTNPLPHAPYLDDAPLILVDNWRELPKLLRKYARDLPTLERYSKAGRQWWDDHCAEQVIGKHVAGALNGIG
jgi:hypothetical protein